MNLLRLSLVPVLSFAAGACGGGHDHATHDHGKPAVSTAPSGDFQEVAASPGYPLKTCVVSGDDLGSMGKPTAIMYKGTEVQFCCAGCIDEFKEDPEKFVSQVRAAKK